MKVVGSHGIDRNHHFLTFFFRNRCRFWLSMSISNTIRLAWNFGPFHTLQNLEMSRMFIVIDSTVFYLYFFFQIMTRGTWDVSRLLMAFCHAKRAVYFENSLYFQLRAAKTMTNSQPQNLSTVSCKAFHHQNCLVHFGALVWSGVCYPV